MSTNVNAPKNLAETTAMLIDLIPSGCYAILMDAYVWVEQVAQDQCAMFSVPTGGSINDLVECDNFDAEHDSDVVEAIAEWMKQPTFGLLRTIEGFDSYARKIFVVSNKGPHPLQQHEEWQSWVMQMYTCVRKHDSRIPDTALDVMRDTLLQK